MLVAVAVHLQHPVVLLALVKRNLHFDEVPGFFEVLLGPASVVIVM